MNERVPDMTYIPDVHPC